MEQYEFKVTYEAPPISEVMKEEVVEAVSIDAALSVFRGKIGGTAFVFSIEMI